MHKKIYVIVLTLSYLYQTYTTLIWYVDKSRLFIMIKIRIKNNLLLKCGPMWGDKKV